jgi:hypothetical protein
MIHTMSFNAEVANAESTTHAFRVGRTMGVLLLLQLVAALTLPFILTKSLNAGSPAFLKAVLEDAFQVRAAVLLSFIGSALTLSLGLIAFRIFQQYNLTIALLFVSVCGISCVLDLMHASSIMSVLWMSERVASSEIVSEAYAAADAIYSARRSTHIIQLVGIGSWMFVFYSSIFRFKLIPRVLAFLGVLGVLSQFIGVTLMMLLGYPVIGEMAMPLLPIEIAVGGWLIVKGFKTRIE